MLPDAGTLKIALTRQDGAVRAKVEPPPALPLHKLIVGKEAHEAAQIVPLIYNICAAAQEAAARSALDLSVPAELEARVAAETLREHVVKLCMVWPTAVGEAAGREALSLAGRAREDAAAADALGAAIFAPLLSAPKDWSELKTFMDAAETAPARAMALIAREWDSGWGRADLPLFDAHGAFDWAHATQHGEPVENGPAARFCNDGLLGEIAAREGHGLLWRMAARLVEVAAILSGEHRPALAAHGVSNAARGAMLVEAQTEGPTVTAFRRLSPTDFALAAGGVLEIALATLPADADAPLERVAQMVVETVDPCIATRLEVHDA